MQQQQREFEVNVRQQRGKGAARRLRREGRVPAVLYGLGKDPVSISMDTKEITRILKSPSGHNQILNLKADGMERSAAMAVDWQIEPVQGTLLHVDMQRIDLNRKVSVRVPIATQGVPTGVKEQGGLEDVVTREVEIECLPLDVPEAIKIDVSELMIGQAIRVRDLPPSDTYAYVSKPERVLVHVIAPRGEQEEEVPAEGEEAPVAEPEVAEKGKAEESE